MIRTTQTNNDKAVFAKGDAKWIAGHTDNSYKIGKSKKAKAWDFESPFDLTVRVVRMKISDNGSANDYYTICTSLNRFQFPIEKIKDLYHMRWGIETSFRELRYALGLINFHAKKEDFIRQEIYAHFLMYNYCERIAMNVVVEQDAGRKWTYVVNHTMAVHICLDYFRYRGGRPSIIDSRR